MKMKNVEDVYRLSPMQEMMLLHSLGATKSDVLFNQLCYELSGQLDLEAFRLAWQQTLDRHRALRTIFVSKGLSRPVQIVRKEVSLPFSSEDWRETPRVQQLAEFDRFCDADRTAGFDLSRAPLMRVAVFRVADDQYYVAWSSHHLVLDRWCISIVMSDVARFYVANTKGSAVRLPPPVMFREYIAWLDQQDQAAAAEHWKTTFSDGTSPTTRALSCRIARPLRFGQPRARTV
jgi:hypothetical protein